MDFKDDVVIVTGGASGIGLEVVKGVVEGGGKVALCDINLEKAEEVSKEIGSDKVKAYYIDLGDKDSVPSTIAKVIEDYGKVDVLINSGGVVSTLPFEELEYEEFERTIRINLTGTYLTNKAVYDHFKDNKAGRIVNVSSVAGKIGGGLLGTAAYATSKAGVNGLTKAVAKEGGKYGIRANAVCPSYTITPMTKELQDDTAKGDRVVSGIALGRPAEPREIAQMILFFGSKNSSFVTGEIGDVDGGIVFDG